MKLALPSSPVGRAILIALLLNELRGLAVVSLIGWPILHRILGR